MSPPPRPMAAPRPVSPRPAFDSQSSVRARSPEPAAQPRLAPPKPPTASPPARPLPSKPAAVPPTPDAVRAGPPPLPTTTVAATPVASKGPPPLPIAAAPERNPFLPSVYPALPNAESPSFALPTAIAAPNASVTFTAVSRVSAPEPSARRLVAAPPVAPPSRVYGSDELPDLLDGRARNRRAIMVVVGVALVVLLGTIAAAIASHYRPI